MSVYVDQLINTKPYRKSENERWNWRQSCHMVAESEQELHEFAARLGLSRSWFQNKHRNPLLWHYDLTANKRKQALRLGAKEVASVTFLLSRAKPDSSENRTKKDTSDDNHASIGETLDPNRS